MRVLIQRVSSARVRVEGREVSRIGHGVLLFVGLVKGDTKEIVARMVEKAAQLRLFDDERGFMNLDLAAVGGEVLSVSQFTLGADLRRGRRPSFDDAMAPVEARAMYDVWLELFRARGVSVKDGVFGAHMDVELVNDGPVTLWLDSDIALARS